MQRLEHHAKALAKTVGIAVPDGAVAHNPQEAAAIAMRFEGSVAVKAQVPTGRRGKAGGVRLVPARQAAEVAASLLGNLVRGHRVHEVLVEQAIDGAMELYLAVTVKPSPPSAVLLVGSVGGVDVEAHADTVAMTPVSSLTGIRSWHVHDAVRRAGLPTWLGAAILPTAFGAYRLFSAHGMSLVEVNPLVIDHAGAAVAVDLRLVPAQPDNGVAGGTGRSDGFSFVELDRNGVAGLITTGAGASMLLVDLLTDAGVSPANFCDLRAGGMRGDPTRLLRAFEELRSYPDLRCIGVNVFAGVTDLLEFAGLLVEAYREASPSVPVIVRLEGSNADTARQAIRQLGLACPTTLEHLVSEMARIASVESVRSAHLEGGQTDAIA